MTEKRKREGLIIAAIGALMILSQFVFDLSMYQTGLVTGVGLGLIIYGFARIRKLSYILKDEDRKADYEASFTDERILMISAKAGRYALTASVIGELVIGMIIGLVFDKKDVHLALCYTACLSSLCYFVIYRYLEKKT